MEFLVLPQKKKLLHPVFVSTVVIRIGAAGIIFIDPLVGWLAWVLLDILDSFPLRNFVKLNSFEYEAVDKYIDTIIFIVMLVVSINYGAYLPLLALFLFRLLGTFLFLKKRDEKYLIYFPNFFEAYWVWVTVLSSPFVPSFLTTLRTTNGLILLGILKILQEIIKHYLGPKYIYSQVDGVLRRA